MTRKHRFAASTCLTATATLLFLAAIESPVQAQQSLPVESGRGLTEGEVLTSGPMHEAFAEALPLDPEPGMVVPNQPPDPIEEILPDQRPAEEEAIWIPGYWGWDEDHDGFVWISGVWRVPPPGADWVPGYWAKVESGYQWIAGYWWREESPTAEPSAPREMVYLPEPPATLEAGPSSPAPSEEHFWIPGCWMWREARYAWRPGYWAAGVPNWVWIPAHYAWAPGGCLFVPGHWDYTLERRGLLFAPVYFDRVVYTRPAFRYVPTIVINTSVLQTSLFIRPRYCHYYYGDYYAPAYRNVGIVAWFSFYGDRHGYDPLFTYHYWRHSRDRSWFVNLRNTYEYRTVHADARPPRTYSEMHRWMDRQPAGHNVRLAARLQDVGELKDLPVRLAPVDEQQRQRYVHLEGEMREFTRHRADAERELRKQDPEHKTEQGRGGSPVAVERGPRRVAIPESPYAQFRHGDRGDSEALTGRRERLQRTDRQSATPAPGQSQTGLSPSQTTGRPERSDRLGEQPHHLGQQSNVLPQRSQDTAGSLDRFRRGGDRDASGQRTPQPQLGPATRAERQPSPQWTTPSVQGQTPYRPLDMQSGRRSRTPSGTEPTRVVPGVEQSRPDFQTPSPAMPRSESGRRARISDGRPDFGSRLGTFQGQQLAIPDRGRSSPAPRSGVIPGLESSSAGRQALPTPSPRDPGRSRAQSTRSRAYEASSAPERIERGRSFESGRRERASRSDRGRGRDR